MSYAEKPEDITREEWMDKLNNVHIQRADMNRLIMNYLVTGEVSFFVITRLLLVVYVDHLCTWMMCLNVEYSQRFLFDRGLQGGSREIQDGVWNRA